MTLNWVDGDFIHSDGEDWRWSSSDGKDQEFKFKKDQMELESETQSQVLYHLHTVQFILEVMGVEVTPRGEKVQ